MMVMLNYISRIKIIIISLMMLSCGNHTEFEDYSARSPVAEARDKIQQGEYVVYAAMGVGKYFPGINQIDGEYIESRYSSIMLNNTSDAIKSSAHATYINSATSFAAAFNQEMVSHLRKRGMLPAAIKIHASNDEYQVDGKTHKGIAELMSWISKVTKGDRSKPFIISSPNKDSETTDRLFKALVAGGYRNIILE